MPFLAYSMSMMKGLVWEARFLTPRFQRLSDSVKSIVDGTSTVVVLFPLGRPSAIIRPVPAIVINSIYGRSGRRLAHVGQEIFKYLPSVANSYATTAVVLKRLRVLVLTSLPHSAPNIVHRLVRHVVGGSMSCVHLAPARTSSPVSEVGPIDHLLNATVARAQPNCPATRAAPRVGNNEQLPEPFSRQVDHFSRHGLIILAIDLVYKYRRMGAQQ